MTPPNQWTVVHGASLFAEPEVMNAVLEAEPYDAEEAKPGMVQTTPMHVAAVCGNVKLIKPLIDAGHPTDVKDRWGRIPLDTACL